MASMLLRDHTSQKSRLFTESVIREMSRLAAKHKAINLAQGFPDFGCPNELKQAACDAIHADINQYAITWGDKMFRDAFCAKQKWYLGLDLDPETNITVTCGSTEAMAATLLATVDPGDEVIVFEPFYENYGPDAIICGAKPIYVQLHPPAWSFDPIALEKAFNNKTRAIIINTPNNPTGKVFSKQELDTIAALCQKWDVLAITDEIYEHLTYDNTEHVAIATLPGMFERTITINGLSKTYSVTGWRIGTIIAPEHLTKAIRKLHDFLTVGAPAPLQRAGATAMAMPETYYNTLCQNYAQKRDAMLAILDEIEMPYFRPQGAYYILCDISKYGFENDVTFTRHLIENIGVAVVPASSFYANPQDGKNYIRFCYCKKPETLEAAKERLLKLK